MYVRILRGQPKPGQVAEVAKRWEVAAAPRLRTLPGFRDAYCSGDVAANVTVTVRLWDEHPDTEAMRQLMNEVSAQMQDITTGPPSVETYEVLAQVQAG